MSGARRAISLVPQLLSVSKTIRALHENKMFSLGFHRGQDEFLLAVDAEGETVSHIADRLAIRPSTVSKMIDRLGEKGLAERLGDARDARRTLIRLTPEGAKMRDPLLAARLELESDIVKGLKPEAIAVITDELVRFADHLAARLRRLR